MKAATLEWIKKAESDWLLAVSLIRPSKVPVHDHACFHFQQAAEKYVKARLEEANVRIPKTHQVDGLIQLALPLEPLWVIPAAAQISDYGVRVRYPGNEATAQEMKTAHQDAKIIRSKAHGRLSGCERLQSYFVTLYHESILS